MSQHGIGELLVRRSRLASDLTCRVDCVLRLDRVGNVRDGDAELCQLVRLHPQPHGILARAEDLGLADAVQARDWIIEVDVGVVGQIVRIVRAMRRIQGDQHERSRGRLLESDSVAVHRGRQLTGCQLFARLREQQVRVGISFEIEIDKQRRLLVGGGVQGVHVGHVVHAVHLLLDGRGDRILECLGIGAWVIGLQPDFGRCDVRKLRYRQGRDRDCADDDHKDRNDHRHDRPIDEEFGHDSFL